MYLENLYFFYSRCWPDNFSGQKSRQKFIFKAPPTKKKSNGHCLIAVHPIIFDFFSFSFFCVLFLFFLYLIFYFHSFLFIYCILWSITDIFRWVLHPKSICYTYLNFCRGQGANNSNFLLCWQNTKIFLTFTNIYCTRLSCFTTLFPCLFSV